MRQLLFLLFLYFISACSLWAQELIPAYRLPISPKIYISDTALKADQALELSNQNQFFSKDSLRAPKHGYYYWFEIDLQDYLSDLIEDSIYFYPSQVEKGALYIFREGKLTALSYNRFEENELQRTNLESPYFIALQKNELIQGNKLLLLTQYIRATPNLSRIRFGVGNPQAHKVFSDYLTINSFKSQVLAFFFLGVASVLMVFNLILFFNMKERQYIYYGLFLLFQLIYYSRISPYLAANFGYENGLFFFWLTTVSQILINTFYLLFIRHFLELQKVLPRFDKVVKGVAILLIFFLLFVSAIIYMEPYSLLQAKIMNWQRYFMASFAFVGVAYLWKTYPGKLVYFVIAGTLVFTTGALMTMFLFDLDYMITGSAIESTIFALGLSYKIKLISIEKREAEKETYQTRLGALRSQINPHFIFNSLSSIQHLISSGQKEPALRYLSKFSKFVRQVLENSIDIHVTLEKEVELLRVYLDLESLRFEHAFEYNIVLPENADMLYEEVPMLIIQPFVENAIKHGLNAKKSGDKILTIHFKDSENYIICEVKDNGIGRKAAGELKRANYRPSRGMSLTYERLKLENKWQSIEDFIQYEDLNPGTKVIIKIPKQ